MKLMDAQLEYGWIKRFVPQKRILTGAAYRSVERFMDVSLVILSMPFWLPVISVIGLIIRITSPGAPVIFTQYRTGRVGKRFNMYKFRSTVCVTGRWAGVPNWNLMVVCVWILPILNARASGSILLFYGARWLR